MREPPDALDPPPGVDRDAWWRALVGDTCDVVAGCPRCGPPWRWAPRSTSTSCAAWSGRRRRSCACRPTSHPAAALVATLDALAALGAELGAVLTADLPDLPGMLVGKLFSALEDTPVAVLPARDGGLCGLAARLPAPDWLRESGVSLGGSAALDRLHAVAPVKGVVRGSRLASAARADRHRTSRREPGGMGRYPGSAERALTPVAAAGAPGGARASAVAAPSRAPGPPRSGPGGRRRCRRHPARRSRPLGCPLPGCAGATRRLAAAAAAGGAVRARHLEAGDRPHPTRPAPRH